MVEKANLTEFRVILKRENPPTDINNAKGTLIFQKDKIFFRSMDIDEIKDRKYALKDFSSASIISFREWFRKKEGVLIEFIKKQVSVEVYFEPIDISAEYLLELIRNYGESAVKETKLSSTVGSFFEKLGTGSQKIAEEIGTIIKSSHDLTHAINQSITFIREATKTANILEPIDETEDKNSINLIVKDKEIDIDDILKRSLASEKIEAMISGLIAKGLISAKNKKFQEAIEALKIAREAAEKENLKEYTEAVDENIDNIRKMESTDDINSVLSEKAVKYATEARNIVTEWEESKDNEVQDDSGN